MPFVQVENLDDDYEDKPVPEGQYDLRITSATSKRTSKGDRDMIVVIIGVDDPEFPGAAAVFHNLIMPNAKDEPDTRKLMMKGVARFLNLFDIPFEKDGFNDEDFAGSTASCLLKQEEYDGEVRNVLVLPRVD